MTRSINSRRGCRSKDKRDKSCYKREQQKKQNNKRNAIRFDGAIFTYKQKSTSIRRERHRMFPDWDKTLYEKYVIPAKESYKNWTWLKGKSNEKGWCPSRYYVYVNGKLSRKYYRCQ